MSDELIVQVARAVCCARARCEGCKGSGEGGCFDLDLWDQEAKAAIAAMQPHIAAEREDAARRALEAAATVAPSKTPSGECETVGQWTRRTLREAIRTIDPAQFRRPADG